MCAHASVCPCVRKRLATHHDNRGVSRKLLAGAGGGVGHGAGQLLVAQLVHAVREALHLAHRQQHGGVLGLDRQHLALGVQRGDLLLVAADLERQLLSKHPREPAGSGVILSEIPLDRSFLIGRGLSEKLPLDLLRRPMLRRCGGEEEVEWKHSFLPPPPGLCAQATQCVSTGRE